jgi:hypothetical protein
MEPRELPAIDNEPLSLTRVTREDGTRCLVLAAGAGHVGLEAAHAKQLAYQLARGVEWATHRQPRGRWLERE